MVIRKIEELMKKVKVSKIFGLVFIVSVLIFVALQTFRFYSDSKSLDDSDVTCEGIDIIYHPGTKIIKQYGVVDSCRWDGLVFEYNLNGELISRESYFKGKRHGECTYYVSDTIINRELYDYGKLISK